MSELKASLPSTESLIENEQVICLDVGGHKFKASRELLLRESCFFEALLSGRHARPIRRLEDGSYFMDGDGKQFQYILNYLRHGSAVSLPPDEASKEALQVEAGFYGLDGLVRVLHGLPKEINVKEYLSKKVLTIREEESEMRNAFLNNSGASLDPHQGLVSLFSTENGIDSLPLLYEPVEDRRDILMDRLRDHTSPAGTPVTVQSLEEFQENFCREHPFVLERLSRILQEEKVVIAGGSVLHALTRSPGTRTTDWWDENKSDVDLFLYCDSPDEANRAARRIFLALAGDGERWVIMRGRGVITMHKYDGSYIDDVEHPSLLEKLQIVLRLYDSPAEVLVGFDCDCCCCAYDGNSVWATPRCLESLRTGVNILNPLHQWPNKASYELRLAKYAYRGFPVRVPGLSDKHIDHCRIQRMDFSELQGLARLLVIAAEMEKKQLLPDEGYTRNSRSFPRVPQLVPGLRPTVKRDEEMLGGYEDGKGNVFLPGRYRRHITGPDVYYRDWYQTLRWRSCLVPTAEETRDAAWDGIENADDYVPDGVTRRLVDAWETEKRSREYLNLVGMKKVDLDNVYYGHAYKQEF